MIDARLCLPYANIRVQRASGVQLLVKSITDNGWSSGSSVTVIPDEDYQKDSKTEEDEHEEKLVHQLPEAKRAIFIRGAWKLIDGMHRCAADGWYIYFDRVE